MPSKGSLIELTQEQWDSRFSKSGPTKGSWAVDRSGVLIKIDEPPVIGGKKFDP